MVLVRVIGNSSIRLRKYQLEEALAALEQLVAEEEAFQEPEE